MVSALHTDYHSRNSIKTQALCPGCHREPGEKLTTMKGLGGGACTTEGAVMGGLSNPCGTVEGVRKKMRNANLHANTLMKA